MKYATSIAILTQAVPAIRHQRYLITFWTMHTHEDML